MSAQFQSPAKSTSNRVSKSVRSGVSRRCAADDECDECPRKRLASRPPLLQTKLIVSQPGDRYEQEAERIAQEMASAPGSAVSGRTATRPVSRIEPLGQRVVDDAETPLDQADVNPAAESAATPTSTATKAAPETTNPPTESAAPSESQTAEGTPEGATLEAAPSAGLIIEDEAPEMAPGQMRKNAFLDELRTAVCAAADAELAAVGRSTQGCPYLARWIGYYRTKDSAHIERAIRKYAPEAVGVTSAREYIPLISERVRRGVATWATTGQITGVPEELASQLPGGGLLGAVGSMVSSVASAVSSVVSGVGSVLSGIGGLFFKARDGGPHEVAGPEALRARLGSEHALDTDVRVRMEGAFGYDFSRVRVHADSRATALSASLNARAFTIGSDVAFGAGEYQPGTLSGDALLAHELAHVVQQGGAVSSDAPLRNGAAEYNALEEDADVSAVGAVVSLWNGTRHDLANIAKNAMPRLRSGLGLRRCPAGAARVGRPTTTPSAQVTTPPIPTVAPACPPALDNPQWDVSQNARVYPSGNRCDFKLVGGMRPSTSPFGPNGMEFVGNIRVAPNCPGRVYFVQYVKPKRTYVTCFGSRPGAMCATHDWGVDTAWPYGFGTIANTMANQSATIRIQTGDSPGLQNISRPDIPQVRLCLNDEFVTYIVYEDASGNPAPLGWLHWMLSAQAWRDTGTCPTSSTANDCSGWHVAGGGLRIGQSFVSGNMGPVRLDRSVSPITPLDFVTSDCAESECPTPAASGGS